MEKRVSRFWQRVNDYGNDEMRDPFSHSSSYHKHFQGYAEQRIPKESGRGTRIERIYVADYYKYEETDAVWRLKKLAYIFLFAVAAAAGIAADSRPLALNSIPAVGIAQILSFIPLVYLLYELILQISAPRQMTIGERDSTTTGFQKASLIYGVYILTIAIAMPIEKWIVFQAIAWSDWAVIGLKLTSGILIFLLYFMERARKLERVPNETLVPSGANEIW